MNENYHYIKTTRLIIWVSCLQSHNVTPRNFNFILHITVKNFPYKLPLCEVTLSYQVPFVS
ncbi:hypothetical protein HanRHA438_Chr08g0365401 [Helianthus annuus]|nr:hypothetical protein HanRHA438_Chr08g0365401 [Helianthus annuus]